MSGGHDALRALAARRGIAAEYHDIWGNRHEIVDETCRALLCAMHMPPSDDPALLLARIEDDEWTRLLPPVRVVRAGEPIRVELNLPAAASHRTCRWTVRLEGDETHSGEFAANGLPSLGERRVFATDYRRLALDLPAVEAPGYHRLELDLHEHGRGTMPLIVAPSACHQPEAIRDDCRVWGLAVQLYGLRSRRNWGMGDFTDLRGVVDLMAESGGAIVGVNPLHALFPDDASRISPYSPSSRAFLNVLYLDVEAIPEFGDCDAAKALVAASGFQARLRELRASELVDYVAVAAAKRDVLALVFRHFREHHLAQDTERARGLRAFRAARGEAMEQQARFEALQAWLSRDNSAIWGWPAWPAEYRDPAGPAVAEFAAAHAEAVDYYAWLQWLAEEQLAAVAGRCRRELDVGLYVDLAVGANPGGAEAWRWQGVLAAAHVGAPPDDFSLLGQDWGIPPFAPHLLREAAYAPLIELLAANMRHAGALRIDHVMGLLRLFWVPAGKTAREGAYVGYPIDDLLGIIALESRRNRCLVIGEDLGTVPDGLRERLAACGFLSYRPLLFQREANGDFTPPAGYPRQALVCASTHDLPTLAGLWKGTDIEARVALGHFPSDHQHQAALATRAHDRARLLAALERERLLPAGAGAAPSSGSAFDERLAGAIHAYLARTPSQVLVVQPEDILGLEAQANLPGSRDDQHPNWRRRLTLDIEDWRDDARVTTLADVMRREHGDGKPSGRALWP